jgi:nucleoside-diphosphate kinase
MRRLRPETAGEFYDIHRTKPFFKDLLAFMTSDRIVALALERDDAVSALRKLVGATDPAQAEKGTIRKDLAANKQENAVHASDSSANAARELSFFFSQEELLSLE